MLQQTQVATVLGYYARFLARFPDVARARRGAARRRARALERPRLLQPRAQPAPLRAGRRRRARRRAFRARSAALARLPGIGRSTAAAIAAFCFGERVAILDGNVKRVLARVLGVRRRPRRRRGAERALWDARDGAAAGTPTSSAYTQGLMDLGATVCLARAPHCLLCPARRAVRRGARRRRRSAIR